MAKKQEYIIITVKNGAVIGVANYPVKKDVNIIINDLDNDWLGYETLAIENKKYALKKIKEADKEFRR